MLYSVFQRVASGLGGGSPNFIRSTGHMSASNPALYDIFEDFMKDIMSWGDNMLMMTCNRSGCNDMSMMRHDQVYLGCDELG